MTLDDSKSSDLTSGLCTKSCADKSEEFILVDDLPPVATVDEVARFLRVTPNLIYEMHKRGEIPGAQRLGRTIRFSTKKIIQWLDSGEVPKRGRRSRSRRKGGKNAV